MGQVNQLLGEIKALKKNGLTRIAVAIDFVHHSLQPLKDRSHAAYDYLGVQDQTRELNREITAEEVIGRIQIFLSGQVQNEAAPLPYTRSRPPPAVSSDLHCFQFSFELDFVLIRLLLFFLGQSHTVYISPAPTENFDPSTAKGYLFPIEGDLAGAMESGSESSEATDHLVLKKRTQELVPCQADQGLIIPDGQRRSTRSRPTGSSTGPCQYVDPSEPDFEKLIAESESDSEETESDPLITSLGLPPPLLLKRKPEAERIVNPERRTKFRHDVAAQGTSSQSTQSLQPPSYSEGA